MKLYNTGTLTFGHPICGLNSGVVLFLEWHLIVFIQLVSQAVLVYSLHVSLQRNRLVEKVRALQQEESTVQQLPPESSNVTAAFWVEM